ncbi:MAG: hypothetical protein SPF22_07695 [Candidatus Onthovivens sp.]|nr:hypothetical protein [Candidatus Onthovivens sp.]
MNNNSGHWTYFSLLDFSLSYSQLFFVSCIGYDIASDGDGNPTLEMDFSRICFNLTTNAMLFILCI